MARRFRSALLSAVVLSAAIATMSSRPVSAIAYAEGFDAVFEQAMIDRGFAKGNIRIRVADPVGSLLDWETTLGENVKLTK